MIDRSDVLTLISLVEAQPAEVRARCFELLNRNISAEIRCLAERAIGLVERHLGNLPGACRHLRRSAEVGLARQTDDSLAGDSLACLATTLAMRGEFLEALSVSTEAAPLVSIERRALLLQQRALILQRLGRNAPAFQCYADAFKLASASTDPETHIAMYNNRGMLFAATGDFVAAEGDLRSALSVLRHSQLESDDSVLLHNLGVVLSRQGRVLEALALLAEVDHKVAATRANNVEMIVDRAELYLQARLLREAEGAALRAAELAVVDGPVSLPEILLLLARVRCAAGNLEDARAAARKSMDAFGLQGRATSTHFADQLLGLLETPVRFVDRTTLTSDGRSPTSDRDHEGEATTTIDDSALIEAALARVRTDRASLRPEEFEGLLSVAAAGVGSTNSISIIQGWCATAMLALHRHNVAGTRHALNETIEHLTKHLSPLWAVELRVLALDRIAPLEDLIVALASDGGETEDLLHWTELARQATHGKAVSLDVEPAGSTVPDFAAISSELRGITDELDSLVPVGSAVAHLLRRRSALEWQLRMMSWLTPSATASGFVRRPRRDHRIDSPVYLVFAASQQQLSCVVRGDGPDRLVPLPPLDEASSELHALRFAHARLLAEPGEESNYSSLNRAALRLQTLVLPKLSDSRNPVVIVPTGILAAVPWSLLPDLRGRELSLSFSLADSFSSTSHAASARSRALIVGGPGLAHADAEIESIAALYADPIVLNGSSASSSNVSRALGLVDVLHVAAHGSRRSDNGLLSAIQLADGPFSSYDLQRVGRTPRTVILSCCDLGAGGSNPFWTLVGIGSTLREHGSAEVVMSVLPVSDESSLKFMITVHRGLLSGSSASAAVLAAVTASTDNLVKATGQSFITMGTT